jgi:hypothetical protein
MPTPALAKIGGGFALALLAAVFVPRMDGSAGEAPALTTLFVSAICVAALTTVALYLALTRDLGVPRLIVGYVVAYNGLVVFVKFVLSPEALYEHSENGTLESLLFDPNDVWGAALVASLVFGLYAVALYVIYRLCRRKLEDSRSSLSWKRVLVGAVLVVAVVFASGGLALLLAFGGLEYLGFVFSSSVSLVVALSLAGAASLAAIAFRDTALRASALGDAALLVSVFWVALVFLALYHVLWVVYVLVLTTIWPLKVITPK